MPNQSQPARSHVRNSLFGFLSNFGIREAIATVAPLWYSHALFPFTLREREHYPQRIRQPQPLGVVATRTLVLPLPQGEGRGEGELALETADSGSFTIGSRVSAFLPMERILIVEDELPMRTALQDVLQAEGYRIMSATDGESGLRRALEEKPDLILLDVMMPRLDGYAVGAELRRLANP